MSTVTIYHNPDCGTSRNTLALIRASGIEPTVIEYLKTPPDRETLKALIARMGMGVRDVLRIKGTPYKELGLDAAHWSDDQLIDQMLAYPILINRPIVVSRSGVRLCRPSDMVIDLLPQRPAGENRKEDGTPLLVDTPIAGSDPDLALALQEAVLPTDDLAEPGRSFFAYATVSGERVGYGGFERLGRDVLVRSLVVLPHARHRGIGGGMFALLLRRAFDEGGRDAWLLTTTAAPFFERAGFKPIERSAAPAAILATRQAASLCPSSAVLLGRRMSL
ncbi:MULTISPECIES: arsenic resistance N-acetyltransferase ArsN2 [Pseudomonadota]|jgi:arsenate reductase|uniref:Arsenate reductase n=1 Tax=Castellaniella defragrans TaxID=75697 RepID=A0A7W9TKV3_CASDE|nr:MULTISPECIES: arsenic resistance N-acetyltransferase ArsN2 [Burkholderiales]EKJ7935410.1 arsenate reductase (glutaredoxin) [Pseudomonas aeruginosa]HAA0911083.1 arsenate reductase (glutaredoxin) [Salmonella enterica]HJO35714.1 arsenic resistance N-acetyltransferase ArsN2 [Gammaproteobacteria bacterium]HNL42757.1 arsenic resistance N-acetyltransferase ArsN2 [Ottowia sp.]AKQ53918.1 Arsenate reductase [Bordetella hinzii]